MTAYKDINQISFDNGNTVYNLQDSRYVVDSTLSSSSTNPVQNNVIYPSLSNFIPNGTTITVKTDGTGDFTTLSAALANHVYIDIYGNYYLLLF